MDATSYVRSVSAATCRSLGGSVPDGFNLLTSVSSVASVPVGSGPPTGWRDTAGRTGIHLKPFKDNVQDCDDFASQLEEAMQAKGFHATFTAILYRKFRRLGPVTWCGDYVRDSKGHIQGHAVTDYHRDDGSIGFWEPQLNQAMNLDGNGDGVVRNGGTEKSKAGVCWELRWFEDRAAAEQGLGNLDP